jgi:vitamin B12 transporter
MIIRRLAGVAGLFVLGAGEIAAQSGSPEGAALEPVVIAATRLETSVERAPSATSVITAEEIEARQYRFVAEALRTVPGLNVAQTGTAGQLTSAFIRGQRSDQTQVLLNGIPINQGLAGLFNFADVTTDNIERIEVIRGPQSALFGPRASGGVINIVAKRGEAIPNASFSFEAGTYDSYRESFAASGALALHGAGSGPTKDPAQRDATTLNTGVAPFDFSVGISRYDTDNDRPNNEYRNWSILADTGFRPLPQLRLGMIFSYQYADASSPSSITNPRPLDNLLTEKWLLAPNLEFEPVDWWKHRVYFEYDEERQINNPNVAGFIGPTRALFRRFQFEYQNDLHPVPWATLTTGAFYSHTDAEQEQPFNPFGPALLTDEMENTAFYGQLKVTPVENLDLYAGARFDSFRNYGNQLAYRFALNYLFEPTQTIFRSSYATGFTPPSSQDRIFGNNPNLDPDETKGFDIGIEQLFWDKRARIGLNFFYNENSNVIAFDPEGTQAFNLGSARAYGFEVFGSINPVPGLTLSASYTYLDARNTSDVAPVGARLIRQPRHQAYASIAYLWFGRLNTAFEIRGVAAREERVFPPPTFEATNIDIEDFVVARLVAEYQLTDWLKFNARIENLFDEEYAEVLGFPALGRTFYGGVTLRF